MAVIKKEVKQLLEKIKDKLRPDTSLSEFEKVKSEIEAQLKKEKINAVPVFGGSIAKGTNIKGDFDCDIFIKFQMAYKDKDISGITEKILKPFSPERLHGSRDYFQFSKKNMKYEIVPVLNIKSTSELVNTTDASPLHADWVKKEIKKKPSLADDIRLTKQFCKSQNVYGAESYIKGFSGHVIDILTIYYGGFLELLNASQKWKEKMVIDFYNTHKGKAMQTLNSSKLDSAIILIDPIEHQRNASASLSIEKFNLFKAAAKEFLKKPSETFFEKKEFSITNLKKDAKTKYPAGSELIIITAESLPGKEDIVGTKLWKAYEYMLMQIKANDFPIINSGWSWDRKKNTVFWLVSKKIEKDKIWPGPPLKVKNAVLAFKKKHEKTFEENGRIFANVKRQFTDPKDAIKSLIKDGQIKSRMKKIKII